MQSQYFGAEEPGGAWTVLFPGLPLGSYKPYGVRLPRSCRHLVTGATVIHRRIDGEQSVHSEAIQLYEFSPYLPDTDTTATDTVIGLTPNATIRGTARGVGPDYNDRVLNMLVPLAANAPLTVTVDGVTEATVQLATNALGQPKSTVAQIIAAVEAVPGADALMTLDCPSPGDGSGTFDGGSLSLAGGQWAGGGAFVQVVMPDTTVQKGVAVGTSVELEVSAGKLLLPGSILNVNLRTYATGPAHIVDVVIRGLTF